MSHKPYAEWMHLALDDALAAAQRAELFLHLETCAACAQTWENLRAADRWLARPPQAAPRPGFTGRFNARLRQRRFQPRAVWGALALGLGAVGSAALILPAGVSLLWSLAQLAGQPAASAAMLTSAAAASQVALTLGNALAIALVGLGGAALVSPLAWTAALGAVGATGAWVYMLRQLSARRLWP